MRKILIKESEIRNYVRHLIREAVEEARDASQKDIDPWLYTDPNEIQNWTKANRVDNVELEELKKMVMRQPYSRQGFQTPAKQIEDAWRVKHGLAPLRGFLDPNTGTVIRNIKDVLADGTPVILKQTPEQQKINGRKASNKFYHEKVVPKREKAKKIEQEEKKEIARQQEIAKQEALKKQWCLKNNINPSSPEAMELYLAARQRESQEWFKKNGLDEFSYRALRIRKARLEQKIAETKGSTDDFDKKVRSSCQYVLKDVERQLRQYFTKDGLPKGRKFTKIDPEALSKGEIETIGKEGKTAANKEMQAEFDAQQAKYNKLYEKDSQFIEWCNEHGCNPKPSTKKVYDEYWSDCYDWCEKNGFDFTDERARAKYKEEFDGNWEQSIQDANQEGRLIDDTTATKSIENNNNNNNNNGSTPNKENDYEEEIIDDNDFGRGDDYLRKQLGYFDNPDEIDMNEFMDWCQENDINTDDDMEMEEAMEEYKRIMGIY